MLQGAPKDFFDNPEKKNELIGRIDGLIPFNDETHRYLVNSLKHSRNPISFFDCLNNSVETWGDVGLADDIYNALKETFSLSFLDIYFNYPLDDSLDELVSDEFFVSTILDESDIQKFDTNKQGLKSGVSSQENYLGGMGIQLDLFAVTESDIQQPNDLVHKIDEANEINLEAQSCHIENELEDNASNDNELSPNDLEEDSDFQSILDSLGPQVTTKKIDGVNVAYKKRNFEITSSSESYSSTDTNFDIGSITNIEEDEEDTELDFDAYDYSRPDEFASESNEEDNEDAFLDFISADIDEDEDSFVAIDYLDDSESVEEQERLSNTKDDEVYGIDSFVDAEELGYLFEDDSDYDLHIEPEYFKDVVTLEERARQKAIEFIQQVDWCPTKDLKMVTTVFIDYGWGPTRFALKRLISYGLEPEELRVVYDIKKIWQINDYFWISYNKNCENFTLNHEVMSWNVAFRISRAFKSYPDAEEVEDVLNRLYEFWMSKTYLKLAYKTFLKFVWTWAFEPKRVLPSEYTYVFALNEMTPEEWQDSTDIMGIKLQEDIVHYGLYEAEVGNPYEYWTEERTRERYEELNNNKKHK